MFVSNAFLYSSAYKSFSLVLRNVLTCRENEFWDFMSCNQINLLHFLNRKHAELKSENAPESS